MFIYIKGPLANRLATERLMETKRPNSRCKWDRNNRHVTDLAVRIHRLCGCEGCQDPFAKEITDGSSLLPCITSLKISFWCFCLYLVDS